MSDFDWIDNINKRLADKQKAFAERNVWDRMPLPPDSESGFVVIPPYEWYVYKLKESFRFSIDIDGVQITVIYCEPPKKYDCNDYWVYLMDSLGNWKKVKVQKDAYKLDKGAINKMLVHFWRRFIVRLHEPTN